MDQLDKKYYRIADVAEMLGLPASTLRYWETEFPTLRPKRNAGGRRLYTSADIEQLRVIRFLIKEKGLTVEGAREHLRSTRQNVDRLHQTIERYHAMRRELTALIDALDARQRIIRKEHNDK